MTFTEQQYGSKDACIEAARSYFRDRRSAARGECPASGKGKLQPPSADALMYHGGETPDLRMLQ